MEKIAKPLLMAQLWFLLVSTCVTNCFMSSLGAFFDVDFYILGEK